MLRAAELVGFVATTDLPRAIAFYRDVLGLDLVETTPIAGVFDAHGTLLRVTLVDQHTPAPFTVLGWSVDTIGGTVANLTEQGVAFERFDGMDQDDQGIWATPGGDRVAWFKDPDGNLLSLTQPH